MSIPEKITIPKNNEYRIETSSPLNLILLSGTAEILGLDLVVNKTYIINNTFIFTFTGCTISISPTISNDNDTDNKPNFFGYLTQDTNIPSILQFTDSKTGTWNIHGKGKTTFIKTVLNYGIRLRKKIVLTVLDPSFNLFTVGLVGKYYMTEPSFDFDVRNMILFYYNRSSAKNNGIYHKRLKKKIEGIKLDCDLNLVITSDDYSQYEEVYNKNRAHGAVLGGTSTPAGGEDSLEGETGLNYQDCSNNKPTSGETTDKQSTLIYKIDDVKQREPLFVSDDGKVTPVTNICVLNDERLFYKLFYLPFIAEKIYIRKTSGYQTTPKADNLLIKDYFYNTKYQRFIVKYENMKVYKIGEDMETPKTALPINTESRLDECSLNEVEVKSGDLVCFTYGSQEKLYEPIKAFGVIKENGKILVCQGRIPLGLCLKMHGVLHINE
ncbi:Polyribonucleotide 5'-hydroxyl-kinase Clp1 [Cucumispora dikerogammari]|nr:Polyribonucleotide 5'-hydroxyl-kinase Clp1 [Cucumispora dikerogammari]